VDLAGVFIIYSTSIRQTKVDTKPTQAAICSRLSGSTAEVESKCQKVSSANKCRSVPEDKSNDDDRPDPFQHRTSKSTST